MKMKVQEKKQKHVDSNSLERYFSSSNNVDNLGISWMPKKTNTTSFEVSIPASSVASSSCSNLVIKLLSSLSKRKVDVKLVCFGGLLDLAPQLKELEEVSFYDPHFLFCNALPMETYVFCK